MRNILIIVLGICLSVTQFAVAADNNNDVILQRLEMLQKSLDNIQTSYSDLDKRITALENRSPSAIQPGGVIKNQPPPVEEEPRHTAELRYGKVRLISTYNLPVNICINGASYYLSPGDTKLVDVPAGVFTYGVDNDKRIRSLNQGETYTVHIYQPCR